MISVPEEPDGTWLRENLDRTRPGVSNSKMNSFVVKMTGLPLAMNWYKKGSKIVTELLPAERNRHFLADQREREHEFTAVFARRSAAS